MNINSPYKDLYTQADRKATDTSPSIWDKDIQLGPALRLKDRYNWYQLMGILMNSGLALTDCLAVMKEQLHKKKIKQIIETLNRDVESGLSLSDSMEKQASYFSLLEIHSMRIGEQTGRMQEIFVHLSHYFESQRAIRKKVTQALSYPIAVIAIASLVMVFMINYVVPMFKDIFDRFQAELPPITQFILALSDQFHLYALSIVGILLIIFLILRVCRDQPLFQSFLSRTILAIPLWGSLLLKLQLSRLCFTFSLLLHAGINMDRALSLLIDIISFYPLNQALISIRKQVIEGMTLYEAMKDHKIFPSYFTQIIRVGEKSAQLPSMLSHMAENLEKESQQQIQQLMQLLEPILIVFLGGIVGVILISMYLPMFELGNAIGN